MSEYFNLINRIREGVLVLLRDPDKPETTEIKFYNKSCWKIFKEASTEVVDENSSRDHVVTSLEIRDL